MSPHATASAPVTPKRHDRQRRPVRLWAVTFDGELNSIDSEECPVELYSRRVHAMNAAESYALGMSIRDEEGEDVKEIIVREVKCVFV